MHQWLTSLPLAEGGGLSSVLPEEGLRSIVDLLVRLVEAGGALVIAVGALVAFVRFLLALRHSNPEAFVPVRLVLGRFLALGLEFQLAGDVLRTAIAPTYQEIGKLAAIAAIRTVLNFFLAREITEERRVVTDEHEVERKAEHGGREPVHAGADGHVHEHTDGHADGQTDGHGQEHTGGHGHGATAGGGVDVRDRAASDRPASGRD